MTREEKILRICEAVKAQSESEQAQDNVLISGIRLAYEENKIGVPGGMECPAWLDMDVIRVEEGRI